MLTARVSIRVPSPAQTKKAASVAFFHMCYFVYILYSETLDVFYKGQTINLADRLHRHNMKWEKATRHGVPWTLICSIEVPSRSDATVLEKKLKNLSRKRLKEFIERHSISVAGPDEP